LFSPSNVAPRDQVATTSGVFVVTAWFGAVRPLTASLLKHLYRFPAFFAMHKMIVSFTTARNRVIFNLKYRALREHVRR